jgi:hypothetical protein
MGNQRVPWEQGILKAVWTSYVGKESAPPSPRRFLGRGEADENEFTSSFLSMP